MLCVRIHLIGKKERINAWLLTVHNVDLEADVASLKPVPAAAAYARPDLGPDLRLSCDSGVVGRILAGARRKIQQVRRRGLINSIFNCLLLLTDLQNPICCVCVVFTGAV